MRQRHLVVLKCLQKRLEFKTLHCHDGCALVQAHVQDDDQTINMKERQDTDQRVVLGEVLQTVHLAHVRDQVVVSEHDAFWESGCAARIRKGHEIFARVDRNRGKISAALEQRRKRRGVVNIIRTIGISSGVYKNKQLLNAGFPRCTRAFLKTLRDSNQKTRARIFQLMRDFVFGIQRVDWRADAPKRSDGMKDDCILRHVGTQNSKDIALLKTTAREAGGNARNRFLQLFVGDRAAGWSLDQRRLVAAPVRVLKDELRQR